MVNLITENIDIWTTAQIKKNGVGRGNGSFNQSLHGIKKLRELILELAVRGKLIPQDPNDEPASVLLEKIAKEKARLIKEGIIKKENSPPEIGEDDKPFELPKGWAWTRLEESTKKITDGEHLSPTKATEGVMLLTAKHVLDNGLITEFPQYVSKEDAIKFRLRCDPELGDVLICSRGTIGRCCVVNIEDYFCLMGSVIQLRTFEELNPHYLNIFLKSITGQLFISGMTKGMAVNALYLKDIKYSPIPLPPLAEQHRIVAKVDELMAICDQLEQQQTDGIAAHQTLVETLLATITSAANKDELTEAWQRIASHFDILFTTERSIDQFKQTILQLAVMGKLVPQDPNDEPASMLLEKIAKEKALLIKEGKIKRQEPLPNITENEKSIKLPEGWEWTRLGNLSANIHYGYTASADHGNAGIRLLRITDIQDDSVEWETVPGCEIEEKKANDYLLEDNDILIARTGGTIGKSYLVENIDVKAVFASYLIRVKRIEGTYPPFIKIYLGSQLYWQQLYKNSMGTGQPNVNATALKRLVFPLPPLAEQHRIVAKVDELMALCDTLKARLKEAQTTQIQLADAIVEQAVI